ncbi:MAG: phenylacetate--CoA ligase family protein [Kiritimatiellae bacterium]|nr:phenylacetate--CoA ligase family protein [Kiritimatiellia bacterium]
MAWSGAHVQLLLAGLTTWSRFPASPGALTRLQSRRLRALLDYAFRHSAYYRDVMTSRQLRPGDFRAAGDLERLPLLEKSAARDRAAELFSDAFSFRDCPRRNTHGTTGEPLDIPTLPQERWLDAVLWARAYLDAGFRPWQRQAKVALPSRIPSRRYLAQRLGLFRRVHVAVTQPVSEKIRVLRAARPRALVCWASTLDEITAELERADSFLDVPRVFSTSSMLWPSVRARAERRLKARVTDMYGAIETGPIAWECEHQCGFHVHSDRVIVELLDEAGRPARAGRVVCTVLWRRAFPLIRYALGDTAEWADGPCPCGRPQPLLRSLTGRVTELVELPGGRHLSSVVLRAAVYGKPGIEQYQLAQETPTRFRLRVVAGAAFTAEVERALLDEFHRQFSGAFELRVEKVPDLRGPPGEKFKPMVLLKPAGTRLERQGDGP